MRIQGNYDEKELLRWCTCTDMVQMLILERKRERKKRDRKRRGKGQTTLFCLPSCFLDFASLAFHISPCKPDLCVGCTNEGLRVLVPSYRAIASAPVIWRTLK